MMPGAALREQLQEYHYTEMLNTGGKYCCSYYSRQVIDDNLKRQIQNQTLCACRLFLLT